MKKFITFLILTFVLIGGFFVYQRYGYLFQSVKNFPKPQKSISPEPTNLPSTTKEDQELQEKISLPENFTISYFASDVPGARSLASSENFVFVGTRSQGVVYALIDNDQDGKADERTIIANKLNSPNGVAIKGQDLYVAEINRIIKFPNILSTYPEIPDYKIVYDNYPDDASHGWKYIAFGPDGKLYVPVGAPCNICDSEAPYASLTRINSDGTGFEIIAEGIRNTVGFDWHPETQNLWFTDNGRDWLGDNRPPDELNHLSEIGQHFGYPYCHGTDIIDPDFGQGKDCLNYQEPAQNLGPHVAALGMSFYQGELFPKPYKQKLFIAEHGSWNRKVPIGYRITTVDVEKNEASNYQVFASGWLEENGDAWGRPVDVIELEDGSILASDDKLGAVYKISYTEN